MREEKCVALIKSLPKGLRRNFVPAPDYARACVQAMQPFSASLLEAMCKQLLRMSGTRVNPEDFDLTQMPVHLQMNFKIEDDKGKVSGTGRVLDTPKAELQGVVAKAIRQVADKGIEKEALTEWSFGDLPKQFEQRKGNYQVRAFPH